MQAVAPGRGGGSSLKLRGSFFALALVSFVMLVRVFAVSGASRCHTYLFMRKLFNIGSALSLATPFAHCAPAAA